METVNIVLRRPAPPEGVIRDGLAASGGEDVVVFLRLGMATCRAGPAAIAAIEALDFVEAVQPDRDVRIGNGAAD